jgi:predicted nucleotidyltransferase
MTSYEGAEQSLAQAVALLEERFDPAAIVLFGSRASGRSTDTSDFDLAILAAGTPPDAFAVAEARTDLEAVLGRAVDLVVLDDASPIVRMEILRNHRALRRRDAERWEDLCVRTLREYFDLKRVRAPIERALLAGGQP